MTKLKVTWTAKTLEDPRCRWLSSPTSRVKFWSVTAVLVRTATPTPSKIYGTCVAGALGFETVVMSGKEEDEAKHTETRWQSPSDPVALLRVPFSKIKIGWAGVQTDVVENLSLWRDTFLVCDCPAHEPCRGDFLASAIPCPTACAAKRRGQHASSHEGSKREATSRHHPEFCVMSLSAAVPEKSLCSDVPAGIGD